MSLDYKPVTLDEYNQSLRDTVNAYYTHALNDPNMSTEDALKSTGEMAEKYLEAVEEFQDAQSTPVAASIENNGNELTDSVEVDNTAEATSDMSAEDEGIDSGEDCEDGLDL